MTFDIDANGILNVSAKDKATNKQQAITITSSSGLSEEEIEKMVKEADSHRDEDIKRKEAIERRNQLDQLAYALDKLVTENKDKIPTDQVSEVETAVKQAKEAVQSGDDERITKEIENINQLTAKISTQMYQSSGGDAQQEAGNAEGGPESGQASESGGDDGEVIDAEYEDMDKK